jgi:hypothetical protein
MKKFWLVFVLSLFCLQSEGQIYAGMPNVDYKIDTVNLSIVGANITGSYPLFMNCDTLEDVNFNVSNENYILPSSGSLRIYNKGFIQILDTTINTLTEIPICCVSMCPITDPFAKFINYGYDIEGLKYLNGWAPYKALISFAQNNLSCSGSELMAYTSYIPLKKKYQNNEDIFGWIYLSGGGMGATIHSITKFPLSLTLIKDTLTCNSSYTFADGFVMNNIYQDTLYDFALPSSTAGCDSLVRTKLHMNFQNFATSYDTVCIGTNYTFLDGSNQVVTNNPTIHHNVFTNINGCDSIIKTILNVSGNYINDTINLTCNNNYTFPDSVTINNIIADTLHVSYLTNISGCDSTITTIINIMPIQSVANISICRGGNYTFPDGTTLLDIKYNTSHTSHFNSLIGCDSLNIINLIIFTNQQNIYVDVCRGENFIYPDSTVVNNIQQNTNHMSNFKSIDGCDSLIATFINVLPSFNNFQNISLCPGSNYTFLDATTWYNIDKDTIHINQFKTKKGCDSLVTTYVYIYPLDKTITRIGDTLFASNNLRYYHWIDCNTNELLKNENSYKLDIHEIGSFAAILENYYNCKDTSECFYVKSISSDNFYYFDIYPNPTTSNITVLILNEDALNTKRELFNSLGQLIISTKENEIDVNHLPKGVYFLKIANQAKKILVE